MSGSSDPQWQTNGVQTNPGANVILADTGAIEFGGVLRVHVPISSDVAVTVATQHRDATNTTTLQEQRDFLSPSAPVQHVYTLTVAANERIRVIVVNGVTGNVSASVLFGRREAFG